MHKPNSVKASLRYGGQLTPCYSAPEQAVMGENLSLPGIILVLVSSYEYLTEKSFPKALDIFIEDEYQITERYLEYMQRKKIFSHPKFPEITRWINDLTIFDGYERMQK